MHAGSAITADDTASFDCRVASEVQLPGNDRVGTPFAESA